MIRWSFWIDSWEHPFSTWFRGQSEPAFIEPLAMEIEIVTPPSSPVGPEPVIPSVRVFTAYELAVIGYYNRFGVDAWFDKKDLYLIEDYRIALEEGSPQLQEFSDHSGVKQRWHHEDYYHDPHAIRIGPYTDETVPQIVKYI